jgi:transposase
LRQRGSLTVWFSEAAITAWRAERRTTPGGQPHYSALAIATALTLRAVFRLALRQTEGLIGSIIRLLGLDLAVPDHSTLSRRAETLPEVRPASSTEPVHLLVDSTGLRLRGPGEWLVEKHGSRTRRSWRKLHLGVDADTGEIVAAMLTFHDADDGSQVAPLLDQARRPLASFTGDGAFDRDDVYGEIATRHPDTPVIVPPRSSAVPSGVAKSAPTQRDKHLSLIAKHGRMGWQKMSASSQRLRFFRSPLMLTGGQVHDIIGARALLARVAAMRQFIGDKAYDADDTRDFLAAQGTEAVISPMPRRLTPPLFNPIAYRMRNLIERAFCKLKDWRGIATRYDKTARNFLAWVCLAVALTHWLS